MRVHARLPWQKSGRSLKILRRPKSRVPPPVKNAKSRSRKNAPKAFFPQFHIIFFRFLVNKMEDELDVMEEREWRRMEAKSFKEGFRQEIISYPKPRNVLKFSVIGHVFMLMSKYNKVETLWVKMAKCFMAATIQPTYGRTHWIIETEEWIGFSITYQTFSTD